jgi:hypothetical protein
VTQHCYHGFGVEFGDLLHQLDAFKPTVTLDLALVGIEGDPVEQALGERRRRRLVQCWQHVRQQVGRTTVEAHPPVSPRIGVADEEPAIHQPALAKASRERPDVVDEDAVCGRGGTVEVRKQPFCSGLEASPRLVHRPWGATRPRGWGARAGSA